MFALCSGFVTRVSPDSKSAMPVLSFCSPLMYVQSFLPPRSSVTKSLTYLRWVCRQVLCVTFLMWRYLFQAWLEFVDLAFLYNFCLRRRRRFVSVVIHGLWILEVEVFVGTFLSRILSKLSLIVPHMESIQSVGLWVSRNKVAKFLASA